jgi:hypothetical protein
MHIDLLINKLGHMENNFVVGFHSNAMLATNHPAIFSMPITIGTEQLDSSNVQRMLSEETSKAVLIGEYCNALVRTLIRESTEAITNYANDTGQYHLIKQNDTFNFARIIRNSFAHSYIISLSDFYKLILQTRDIEWNGKSISLAMEGKSLEKTFFGYQDAVALFNDLHEMCRNELT